MMNHLHGIARYLLAFCLIPPVLTIILSCEESTDCFCPPPPSDIVEFADPIDSVAADITLIVYSEGSGAALDTIELDTEGPATIDVDEQDPLYDPPRYYIHATCPGFYTELYHCEKGEAIDVDLDAVPNVANAITGVIIAHDPVCYNDYYYGGFLVALSYPGSSGKRMKTDSQGRYGFSGLDSGYTYILHFQGDGVPQVFEIQNTPGTDYRDLFFIRPIPVDAPCIYLYPETETTVTVRLEFPRGCSMIASQPEYNQGWSVNVAPDGRIDGQYDYLFYEFLISAPLARRFGWLLDGSCLERELRDLLSNLNFIGREIDDFVAFWIPRLEGHPWYAVYPQDAGSLVSLDVSPRPENVLREIFLIVPLTSPREVPAPADPVEFSRDGFTVVEWGVIDMTK